MNTIRIDILNPKAKKLLRSLEDLNLITIRENSEAGFSNLLNKLRAKDAAAPSMDEITKEVELVRSKRYGKKSN